MNVRAVTYGNNLVRAKAEKSVSSRCAAWIRTLAARRESIQQFLRPPEQERGRRATAGICDFVPRHEWRTNTRLLLLLAKNACE